MKNIILVFIITLLFSCKTKSSTENILQISLEAKSNSKASGTATFTEKNGVVTLKAEVSGLTPGIHAIHIHEKSDCSAPDGTSTGGHWNPTYKKHGKFGQGEYHKGDIGNYTADRYGKVTIVFQTDEWCIGCGDETKDIIGKGLIIHADPDDFVSQPTGNAGARVACAGIIR